MTEPATEVADSPTPSTEPGTSPLTDEVAAGPATQQENDNPYSGILNSDGTFVEGWPDLLKGDSYAETRATAANYKDLPSLLKGLKDSKSAAMQRLDGMVKLPGAEASPEDIAAYRTAIGVPETVDGYQFDATGLPEGNEIDAEIFGEFAALAHSQNLTPAQVNEITKFQVGLEGRMAAENAQMEEASLAEQKQVLETAWGAKFQENFMLAQRAAKTFGLEPDNPVFKNADAVMAFAKVAASLSEDRLVSGEQISNRLSPEHQADDIMSNSANPLNAAYHSPDHPQHKEAVAQFTALMKKAFPG